jgi:hypothetical protein
VVIQLRMSVVIDLYVDSQTMKMHEHAIKVFQRRSIRDLETGLVFHVGFCWQDPMRDNSRCYLR